MFQNDIPISVSAHSNGPLWEGDGSEVSWRAFKSSYWQLRSYPKNLGPA